MLIDLIVSFLYGIAAGSILCVVWDFSVQLRDSIRKDKMIRTLQQKRKLLK